MWHPHHSPHKPNRPDPPPPPPTANPKATSPTFPDPPPGHPRGPASAPIPAVESGPIQTRPPLPVFGASQAPAGAVVFHRFLADLNRTTDAAAKPVIHRAPDRYEPCPRADTPSAPGATLLPKLGEVLPVSPEPRVRAVTEVRHIQRSPATGRLIDLMA